MCAVQSVLNEPRFKFETEAAKTAYRLASMLVQNKDIHKGRIIQFANVLEENPSPRKSEDLLCHHSQNSETKARKDVGKIPQSENFGAVSFGLEKVSE